MSCQVYTGVYQIEWGCFVKDSQLCVRLFAKGQPGVCMDIHWTDICVCDECRVIARIEMYVCMYIRDGHN